MIDEAVSRDFLYTVLGKLNAMQCGEIRPISAVHHAKFIVACKIIHDWGLDEENGFIVDCNSAYNKVRKTCIDKPLNPKANNGTTTTAATPDPAQGHSAEQNESKKGI